MNVGVMSPVTSMAINKGIFLYSRRTSHKNACTVSSGSGVFDEFDCEETVRGRQAWVRFAQMVLYVGGASSVTVSKAALSSLTFDSLVFSPSITSLTVTVPIGVVSYTVGTNTKQ